MHSATCYLFCHLRVTMSPFSDASSFFTSFQQNRRNDYEYFSKNYKDLPKRHQWTGDKDKIRKQTRKGEKVVMWKREKRARERKWMEEVLLMRGLNDGNVLSDSSQHTRPTFRNEARNTDIERIEGGEKPPPREENTIW